MATKFAAREVLVLATVPVGLIARIERVLMEISKLIVERPGLTQEGLEDVGAVIREAIPGLGPCSFSTRRISWVSEDELLQEVDHLSKQSFVPKAILHW